MSSSYEIWLTDDAGRKLALLNSLTNNNNLSFLAYTRALSYLGTINFGLPFRPFAKKFNPWFRPDWRVEVWRSAGYGIPSRLEDVFFLRKPNVYTRSTDQMEMIQFYGRNGVDLLNRRYVIQAGGTQWASKTDFADDMMKEIVSEQMLYGSALDETGVVDNTRAWPSGEFSVEAAVSAGPSVSLNFENKKVFDVLASIKEMTFQKNRSSPTTDKRVYFNVVPVPQSANTNSPVGWRFITRSGLYGIDRTQLLEFSRNNDNIGPISYTEDHLDEVNAVFVQGNGRGETQIVKEVVDTTRAQASRWNRCEGIHSASNLVEDTALQDAGESQLEKGRPKEGLPVEFLNSPGGPNTPRSLYGIDWDLGDQLRVDAANKQFNAEVIVVYVSVNDQGDETITGRNELGNATV